MIAKIFFMSTGGLLGSLFYFSREGTRRRREIKKEFFKYIFAKGSKYGTIGWHKESKMRLTEDIKPISYVKTHPADLIKEVTANRRPIVITQKGTARAVLLDIESYEKQKNALMMLRLVAQGEHDIKNGNLVKQDEFFKEMDRRLDISPDEQ
jgi:prevent-host-death family protein